ncbi:MAG: V-type proton ATPase subunit E [Promethearchaeota archaeon]|nr:MAG: V-type proton ATPase subunit E [Candidatus Lokiarchaeota archaeon]
MRISDKNFNIKSRFGKLGMHLIEQAKDKIKDLNQEMLFRKAEIKKRYRNRLDTKSNEIRQQFVDDYNNILNMNLSSTLLESKDRILELKNNLIKVFITDLHKEIENHIKSNYQGYLNYLIGLIREIKGQNYIPENSIFYFNEKDYEFFEKNNHKLTEIIQKEFIIKRSSRINIGGLILEQADGEISFDYTIDNIIEENYSLIEMEFSDIIKDAEIKKIQSEFEDIINENKKKIETYLIDYDRI